jgi:hypothetical protein
MITALQAAPGVILAAPGVILAAPGVILAAEPANSTTKTA